MSVTTGIVSSFGFHDESRAWLIQTDAALNPGNSGGPMLDDKGQVVGIVSARVDPVVGENIGFAIAMRTVSQELDTLEAGTLVATTPTPVPWYSFDSGTLVHDPNDDGIGCSSSWLSPTVIRLYAIDSAAFVKFEVPDKNEFSIGFLYHEIDDLNNSATFIWRDNQKNIYASHWSMIDGDFVHGPITHPIPSNVIETGDGDKNELVFRTSSNGSFIRLNNDIVIEVPRTRLIRKNGRATLCIGFNREEKNPYSVEVADIRTRFDRSGKSGLLTGDPNRRGRIGCPESVDEGAYVYRHANDAWVLTDFIVPAVAAWSFGFVYHGDGRSHSRTFVGHDGEIAYATHVNVIDNEKEVVRTRLIDPGLLNDPQNNLLEFETTSIGSKLRLNGEVVIEVAAGELNRKVGPVELCAGLAAPEDDPYWTRYSDLWAWTDWSFR